VVALLVAIIPLPIVEDECDCLEIHSFYSEAGDFFWTQIIAWDVTDEGYRVAWWQMKPHYQISASPAGTVVRLTTEHLGVVTVRPRSVKVTHSQSDPELEDRKKLPQSQRRGLRNCLR
jgi:hypothetical protein